MSANQFVDRLHVVFFHAFEMPERAFIISYLTAGPAPQVFDLHHFTWNICVAIIRAHPKSRNGIAPYTDHRLL